MALEGKLRALRVGIGTTFAMAVFATAGAAAHTPSTAHPLTHGPDPAVPGLRGKVSAKAASAWCGTPQSSDDVTHQVDNGAYRYHGIYLVPADGTDRFAAMAGRMQADAFGASGLLERSYNRAIRFDMGTRCGPANMDISSVRTTLTTADFARASQDAGSTLDLVTAALSAAGFQTLATGADRDQAAALKRNFVVWLDGPAPAGTCGVAQVYDDATRKPTNWNNYGGKVAVVFRNGDGFCGEASVRHEIGHTLGAIQPHAPHAFDGSHCNDAFEDSMCYANAPSRGSHAFQNQYFDYGNDDYWDPPQGKPLDWWTANLNQFVCDTATCNSGQVSAVHSVVNRNVRSPRSSRAIFRTASARRAAARTRLARHSARR